MWNSRNVRHTHLQLRVPIWVRDLGYTSEWTVATVTAHRHVRLYDSRVKRRPVMSVTIGEDSLMSMAVTHAGNEIVVGDTRGTMRKVELRKGRITGMAPLPFVARARGVCVRLNVVRALFSGCGGVARYPRRSLADGCMAIWRIYPPETRAV